MVPWDEAFYDFPTGERCQFITEILLRKRAHVNSWLGQAHLLIRFLKPVFVNQELHEFIQIRFPVVVAKTVCLMRAQTRQSTG